MSEQPRPRRIEIPQEVAAAEGVPDDLDADLLHPYAIPDVTRRRRAAVVYVAGASLTGVGVASGLPTGMWFLVGALGLVAAYHVVAGWPLAVREGEALEIANRATEFAVGHASAAVGFTGLRARPVWNVLVFSADEPPSRRGLVRVDAVDGAVVGRYVEAVPEP